MAKGVRKEYPIIRSAGGVLINTEREVLLCHPTRSARNNWRLPKGEVGEKEDPRSAALREVLEETGYKCRLLRRLASPELYKTQSGGHPVMKLLVMYLMRPVVQQQKPDWENDQFLWVSEAKAMTLCAPRECELIREAFTLFDALP